MIENTSTFQWWEMAALSWQNPIYASARHLYRNGTACVGVLDDQCPASPSAVEATLPLLALYRSTTGCCNLDWLDDFLGEELPDDVRVLRTARRQLHPTPGAWNAL
jgi:hypothetical protein